MDLADLNSYIQLIHDIIGGTVRRHTFTPPELDLLLDVQATNLRKTTKNETLRRYLRSVQQQFVTDSSAPLRFARFWEMENHKNGAERLEPVRTLFRARTASSA
jgi:hypothetical protein